MPDVCISMARLLLGGTPRDARGNRDAPPAFCIHIYTCMYVRRCICTRRVNTPSCACKQHIFWLTSADVTRNAYLEFSSASRSLRPGLYIGYPFDLRSTRCIRMTHRVTMSPNNIQTFLSREYIAFLEWRAIRIQIDVCLPLQKINLNKQLLW